MSLLTNSNYKALSFTAVGEGLSFIHDNRQLVNLQERYKYNLKFVSIYYKINSIILIV
jgi:hypothetical protein